MNLFGALTSQIGNWVHDWATSAWKQDKAEDMMEDQQNFARDQTWMNQNFSERMYDTRYQKTVEDMKRAGLNPMLTMSQGAGHQPSGGAVGAPGMSAPSFNNSGYPGIITTAAQISNIKADTEVKEKAAAEIAARTQTYPVSIDVMKAQIQGIQQTIEKQIAEIGAIHQQAATAASQERLNDQQVRNLQSTIPQIEATIKQLKAQTTLTYADAKLRGIQSDLTESQWKEVNQRIAANLPAADAALLKVKEALLQLERPQAGMRAATYSTPAGALGELFRALNPFLQVMPRESSTTITR